MKKIIYLLILISCLNKPIYSEIKIKIHEPIRFKNINTRGVGELIVGEGSLEITSDNLEEDLNKKLVFKFPEKGAMTNKKWWLEIEKYEMEKSKKSLVITTKKKIIKIYAILRRERLRAMGMDASIIEGEYIGAVPIFIEQYSKGVNKTNNTENKNII